MSHRSAGHDFVFDHKVIRQLKYKLTQRRLSRPEISSTNFDFRSHPAVIHSTPNKLLELLQSLIENFSTHTQMSYLKDNEISGS